MKGPELEAGRARVEAILIAPLERLGARWSGSDAAALKDDLRARLAYMGEVELEALREWCERSAKGKRGDLMPKGIEIMNRAAQIAPPPATNSRLVTSYMASAAGRAALAEGYAPELLAHLKATGLPANPFIVSRLQTAADGRRGAEAFARRRAETGDAAAAADVRRVDARDAELEALVYPNGREAA